MKLNNRGLTLVELIVSFAILGIVSVAVFGMLLTSTKTYTSLTTSVKLQYEAQLAMGNIERHILNCNKGLAWNSSDKELFIINEEGTNQKLQVVYLDNTNGANELYYGTETLDGSGRAELRFYLLAEHVTGMNVTFTTSDSNEIKQAQLELTLTRNGKSYTSKKIIALRNKPLKYNGSLSKQEGSDLYDSTVLTPNIP